MHVVDVLEPAGWARCRALRLVALADSPDAFWTTLADEEPLDESAWRGFEPTGATCRFPAPRDHIVEHELARDLRPGATG